MDMKNYTLAIEDFNQAISCEETFPENYYYRGLARIELSQLKEAIDDFNLVTCISTFLGIGARF